MILSIVYLVPRGMVTPCVRHVSLACSLRWMGVCVRLQHAVWWIVRYVYQVYFPYVWYVSKGISLTPITSAFGIVLPSLWSLVAFITVYIVMSPINAHCVLQDGMKSMEPVLLTCSVLMIIVLPVLMPPIVFNVQPPINCSIVHAYPSVI